MAQKPFQGDEMENGFPPYCVFGEVCRAHLSRSNCWRTQLHKLSFVDAFAAARWAGETKQFTCHKLDTFSPFPREGGVRGRKMEGKTPKACFFALKSLKSTLTFPVTAGQIARH